VSRFAQFVALIEQAGLAPQDWQTALLIINPPALNYGALAEVLNLQAMRAAARVSTSTTGTAHGDRPTNPRRAVSRCGADRAEVGGEQARRLSGRADRV